MLGGLRENYWNEGERWCEREDGEEKCGFCLRDAVIAHLDMA